eukprot:3070836-Rhodomonas_salina.1
MYCSRGQALIYSMLGAGYFVDASYGFDRFGTYTSTLIPIPGPSVRPFDPSPCSAHSPDSGFQRMESTIVQRRLLLPLMPHQP